MIADAFYLAFTGLELCHAACRLMMSSGLSSGLFGPRLRIWWWPRSRNHRASIKSP
ncbi:hypothetical protein [Bradyrhizobium betae]|uniref:hypothetical protein n=1 Tax=Bradyrhizobium betae TaxID=244734 RepID=UPI0013E9334B|nr:hypothetical protein [Bradyrhizobium betae]